MDLKVSIDNQIGWIVFNRPHLRNAISQEMWEAIPQALRSLKEAGARVIIFRGEGNAFAAGADLNELVALQSSDEAARLWQAISVALNAVASFELPTIAMIVGPCLGGGCLLATACDLRFADTHATFSLPIAQLGLAIDKASIARLISLVGRGFAAELLYTGSVISAARAQSIALLNGVAPLVQLERLVSDAAESVAANSPFSIEQCKTSIAGIYSYERLEDDQQLIIDSYLSADFKARATRALARNTKSG